MLYGVLLAFVAMLSWGVGDFLIQKSTRRAGNWGTLFAITLVGTIILLPFSVGKVWTLVLSGDTKTLVVLFGTSIVLLVAALLDFEALRVGKITVVEPIWSTEIIFSALLAFIVLKESLSLWQVVLIIAVFFGLLLVSVRKCGYFKLKHFIFERGVFLAFLAALMMGGANFMFGWGARISDPILVNFFVNVVVTVLTGLHLIQRNKFGKLIRDVKESPKLFVAMTISDNIAWIAFAFAMTLAPIGVVVALSESYIIIAVLLGYFVSREKLQAHQKFGIILGCAAILVLAYITA